MLHLLATAETIAERALLVGMVDQLPYKSVYQGMKHRVESFASMINANPEDEAAA